MSDQEQEFINEAQLFLSELKKANSVHLCSKEDFLDKVDLVLFGDIPTDKKGMFFMFSEFIKDHKIVVADINEIKKGVAGLHTRADENKEAAQKVANALTEYKKETRAFELGGSTVKERLAIAKDLKARTRQAKWQRYMWVIMALIAIASIWFGFYRSDKKREISQEEINHRIDMTKGYPDVTRGWLHFRNNGLMDSVYLLKK